MVDQPYIIKPRRGFVGRLRWWLFRQNQSLAYLICPADQRHNLQTLWRAKVEDLNAAASSISKEHVERIRAYEEALTPSGDTKCAYNGEVRIPFTWADENGCEHTETVNVTWTATKQIMKMIRSRAES